MQLLRNCPVRCVVIISLSFTTQSIDNVKNLCFFFFWIFHSTFSQFFHLFLKFYYKFMEFFFLTSCPFCLFDSFQYHHLLSIISIIWIISFMLLIDDCDMKKKHVLHLFWSLPTHTHTQYFKTFQYLWNIFLLSFGVDLNGTSQNSNIPYENVYGNNCKKIGGKI